MDRLHGPPPESPILCTKGQIEKNKNEYTPVIVSYEPLPYAYGTLCQSAVKPIQHLFYLTSVAVPSRVHADRESFYEENPPIAHLEVKTSRVCWEKALPEVQRPQSKEKPTSCRLSYSISIEGFCLPCFTNVSARCNTTSTSNMCLVMCPLPRSFLSFVYFMS